MNRLDTNPEPEQERHPADAADNLGTTKKPPIQLPANLPLDLDDSDVHERIAQSVEPESKEGA
jgi:hypothetical protein